MKRVLVILVVLAVAVVLVFTVVAASMTKYSATFSWDSYKVDRNNLLDI